MESDSGAYKRFALPVLMLRAPGPLADRESMSESWCEGNFDGMLLSDGMFLLQLFVASFYHRLFECD